MITLDSRVAITPTVPPLRRGSAEHRSSSFPEARLPNPKSTAARDLNQHHPRSGKDLGVEISFGEWMMAFGFAEFVIASLLFEYA
jgi:hypothetical protein